MSYEYDYMGDMSYYQNQLAAKGITKEMLDMDNYVGLTARELQGIVDSARIVKKPLKSFDNLKHGDKIISPIDNEVTGFWVDNKGEKYLAGKKSMFPLFQFTPPDFYMYRGMKDIGEVDTEYLKDAEK